MPIITKSQEQYLNNKNYLFRTLPPELSKSEKKLAEFFYGIKEWSKKYMSHRYMREETGLSISSIKQILRRWKGIGIIDWHYIHRHTNWYTLPSLFFELPFIKSKILSLVLLLASLGVSSEQQAKCPPFFKKDFYNITSLRYEKDTRPSFSLEFHIKKKPKRKKVNDFPEREKTIEKFIEKMPLTELALIELMKYPNAALRFALSCIYTALKMKSPVHYLFKLCEQYCTEHDLYVDRDWKDKVRHERGYKREDCMYIDLELLKHPKKQITDLSLSGAKPLYVPDKFTGHEKSFNEFFGETRGLEHPGVKWINSFIHLNL